MLDYRAEYVYKDYLNAILSGYIGFSDGTCWLSSTNCHGTWTTESIDLDRPPKDFKEGVARRRSDQEQWAKAYRKEFQGFKGRKVLAVVEPPQGKKIS